MLGEDCYLPGTTFRKGDVDFVAKLFTPYYMRLLRLHEKFDNMRVCSLARWPTLWPTTILEDVVHRMSVDAEVCAGG